MILLSDIRPELHRRGLKLVPERYESFDELLNLALENQLRLEEHGMSGSLDSARELPSVDPPPQASVTTRGGSNEGDPFMAVRALEPGRVNDLGKPPDAAAWSMPVLWGQVNRVLPIIAGVRVLGHLLSDADTSRIPLGLWHERAAGTAVSLHDALLALDHKADRRRGDLWSIGFPRGDRASMRRYCSQFLGRGSTRSPGAAEMIGLVSISPRGGETVAEITPAGVEWCSLPNPVFDLEDESAETISKDEAALYLQILARQLPGERTFMALMGELIEATASRTALEEKLAGRMPELGKYASTMRAGAIGRLHDLGFLARERAGTSVQYSLAERAKDLHLIS